MKPATGLLGGIVCLMLWVVLAFVLALPSGWVHLPLAAGVVLIASAIVESGPQGPPPPPPEKRSSAPRH